MHSKISAVVAFLHITETSRLLEVLRDDNRAIVRAASLASQAADYLLGFLPTADDASPTAGRAAA